MVVRNVVRSIFTHSVGRTLFKTVTRGTARIAKNAGIGENGIAKLVTPAAMVYHFLVKDVAENPTMPGLSSY